MALMRIILLDCIGSVAESDRCKPLYNLTFRFALRISKENGNAVLLLFAVAGASAATASAAFHRFDVRVRVRVRVRVHKSQPPSPPD